MLRRNLLRLVSRKFVAEMLGTALLLVAIVGSGIMGDRLSGGNGAIALLANSTATGAALVVLILAFGPVSGAHFNPAVSVAAAMQGGLSWMEAACYSIAQIGGAFLGVALADVMFGEPVLSASTHARAGWPLALSEVIATFGLFVVIWSCSRRRASVVPFAVGAYIAGAYWFTSSTSFANPAVTLARAATNTFAGIRPSDVPFFLIAQLIGAAAATSLCHWLVPVASSAEGATTHVSV
ncbi:MAG TPA: MIP/aquaporin family protein [Vicinamibacterales bacterium]|nr:MIP/aquaporin family protein [Vicinamibacterales bacterium]